VPVNLPTLTTQVLHFICSLFYPISSRFLTIFVNFYVRFTLFIVLLYFIISQRFSWYTSTIFLRHAVSHSYNVMVSFAFFDFIRHSAHCFLLLVSCMLYVVKKHCPEEAHLNRWAKCRLKIKIARRSNLSAWFETWWQTLRNNNMSSKKNSNTCVDKVWLLAVAKSTVCFLQSIWHCVLTLNRASGIHSRSVCSCVRPSA